MDLGVFNFPYSMIKNMMGVLPKINIGRQRGMFILNAPSTFSVLFKGFSMFAPAAVLAKIQVTSGNTNEIVSQMICPE